MVWGVCRRLLNQHDAEDAFQATFLVLVRKAASIVPRQRVANWLYGVAHQTALQARRNAARRRTREKQVTEMPEPAVMEQDLWSDLQPLLDRELSRLPAAYREVIVLSDLEGKTRKEVARQLGLPEGTVGSRLARARTMLAKRLARHGLAVLGGALAAVLSEKAASAAVPTSVVSSTIKAVTFVAAGQVVATGTISVKVAALTEGVLKTMLLSKLKNVALGLLLVFFLMAGAGAVLSQPSTGEQPEKGKTIKDAEKLVREAEKALNNAKMALNEARENTGKQVVVTDPDKSEAMIKSRWEYKALPYSDIKSIEFNKRGTDTADGGLNMLGDEGWELAAIEPPVRGAGPGVGPFADRPALYVFKRQKH
jgi:RNA polymerase sigma factor (sigma-70 family)